MQHFSEKDASLLYKLHCITYVRNGFKPMPFKAFQYLVSNDELCKVFVAKFSNKMMGYAIALTDYKDGKVYYAYPSYFEDALKYNVPSLLAYSMIEWSLSRNMVFDFSGIGYANEKQASISFFKKSFGGVEEKYYELKFYLISGLNVTTHYVKLLRRVRV